MPEFGIDEVVSPAEQSRTEHGPADSESCVPVVTLQCRAGSNASAGRLASVDLLFRGAGLALGSVAGLAELIGTAHACATVGAVLNDMRQFVHQQPAAIPAARREFALREHDVLSDRVGVRVHGICGARRRGVGMNTDAAEIVPEAWLHRGAGRGVEGLARRIQRGLDHRRKMTRVFSAVVLSQR